MARSADEDRPKRSWREIDKKRDGGGSRRQTSDERAQERLSRSPVYEQYKTQVSRFFEGGDLPDAFREKLDPSGTQRVRADLLKSIKTLASDDRKKWADAVALYVAEHELPEDAYLLTEWLDHPRGAVVEKVLGRLDALLTDGTLTASKLPKSLPQRLRSLEMDDEPEVQTRARTLRERLES